MVMGNEQREAWMKELFLLKRGWLDSMSSERLVLSDKYKAFLKCNAPVEFLEG